MSFYRVIIKLIPSIKQMCRTSLQLSQATTHFNEQSMVAGHKILGKKLVFINCVTLFYLWLSQH